MLQIFAPEITTSVFNLGLLSEKIVTSAKQVDAANGQYLCLSDDELQALAASIVAIGSIAKEFSFLATETQTNRIMLSLAQGKKYQGHTAFLIQKIEQIGYSLNHLSTTFTDELRGTLFYGVSSKYVSALRDVDPPFGEEVANAFPSAAYDIVEAGKCRALGRWTASVMHLMRALDPALLAFQTRLNVSIPKENWQQIIDQIESAIKAQGHKHPDHQWNSEASAFFRVLKDAWRNFAMHGKDRYDEERAGAVYESVRGFMRHLATRLSE